jgi:hypothetical protein
MKKVENPLKATAEENLGMMGFLQNGVDLEKIVDQVMKKQTFPEKLIL